MDRADKARVRKPLGLSDYLWIIFGMTFCGACLWLVYHAATDPIETSRWMSSWLDWNKFLGK